MELIKLAAFQDELEKLGVAPLIPKLMMAVAKSFGRKGTATLIKGKGLTGSVYRHLRGASKAGKSFSQTIGSGIDRAAVKWGNPVQNFNKIDFKGSVAGPRVRSLFGYGGLKSPLGKPIKTISKQPGFSFKNFGGWAKSRPQAWTGEAASNLQFAKQHGVGKFMKNIVRRSRTFTGKETGLLYKRSPLGQVVNPIMGTGLGFGAMDFMSKTNPKTGKPYGLVKRVARGTGTAAGWTVAPSAMVTGMMGSFGKSLITR